MLKRENAIIELKNDSAREYAGIIFKEIAFAQKINIRGNSNNKNFMSLYGKVLQAVLPTIPNSFTSNGKIKVLWLGPNQCLVVNQNANNKNELKTK